MKNTEKIKVCSRVAFEDLEANTYRVEGDIFEVSKERYLSFEKAGKGDWICPVAEINFDDTEDKKDDTSKDEKTEKAGKKSDKKTDKKANE